MVNWDFLVSADDTTDEKQCVLKKAEGQSSLFAFFCLKQVAETLLNRLTKFQKLTQQRRKNIQCAT